MQTNRREFLQASAAALSIGGLSVAGATPVQQPDWYSRPMRWAQLAFVEDDPGNYDQAFWIDYFRRTHADAACLSAGGCIAFYPTEIPLHYRSKWLGNHDSFGDLAKACRDIGMNVVARTDPHAVHQDVYDAHPDWIAVDAQGKKRRHWADPDFWVTCALGPYNFDFMTRVNDEIMNRYHVDGIFSNRWAGSGMCYCEHCQKNFRDFSGMDLPRTNNPQVPARREYLVWNEKRLFELWRLWDSRIKAINPNAAYIANAGGGALSGLDMKTIGELAPTLFADRQARHGVMPPWANGKNGKEYRATLGKKAIAGIVSVGLEEEFRWKDSVQSGDEIRMWMADGIAQGLRPWFTKFNAKPIDKRWLPVVEQVFDWHYRNQEYMRNEDNLARVAMVYSQQTATFYGGEKAHSKVEDPSLGFYQALIEGRIPFEMVHDRLLDADHLAPYKTLILPNIAALTTAQCAQLEAFVTAGGSIVATYETSLYDEWGVQRKDFGLASLFGVSFDGQVSGPMLNSYLTIEKDGAGHYHPIVAELADATRIINGVNRVGLKIATTDLEMPLKLVPSYPDLPMEEVFTRPTTINQPGMIVRKVGRGRVVYFPGDIDRTFWEVLCVDHGKLMQNAVLWATNEPLPVSIKGLGVLDIAVWTQKNSMTVQMVNLTNPMMMKGPISEIIPMPPQQVKIQIPKGRALGDVKLLVANRRIAHKREGDSVSLELPSIGLHEVIAVDFKIG